MHQLFRLAAGRLVLFLGRAPVPLPAQGWGTIDRSIPMANTGFLLSSQMVASTIDTGDSDPPGETADRQAALDQFAIPGIMAAPVPGAAGQMPPGADRDRPQQSARAAGARYLHDTFGVPAAQITIDTPGLRVPGRGP